MKKIIKLFLSFLLVIAAAMICLYFFFPSDLIINTISSNVKKINPDYHVTIEKASPAFPLYIELDNVQLYREKSLIFDTEKIVLSPDLLSFLGKNNAVGFTSHAYDGLVKGSVRIDRNHASGNIKIVSELSDIQVNLLPVLEDIDNFSISGILNGRVNYQSMEKSFSTGINISEAVIKMENPVLNLDTLSFRDIDADIKSLNDNFEIISCTFSGEQLDMTISGTGIIKNKITETHIDMAGVIELRSILHENRELEKLLNVLPQLKTGKIISFNVKGQIDNPIFSFKLNN